jgi:hypothetical protein
MPVGRKAVKSKMVKTLRFQGTARLRSRRFLFYQLI